MSALHFSARSLTCTALVTVLSLTSLVVRAQADHTGHADRAMAAATPGANASTQAYEVVNNKMHRDMAITFTGDADRDFLAGMIPHHQGAIGMAEVVLKHGKDKRVRQLARGIISAQQREIAQMRAWLEERDAKR
jgi:uncharacterized protein (DUF305 family)